MAHGFDELVNFLLDEVALRFAEGESDNIQPCARLCCQLEGLYCKYYELERSILFSLFLLPVFAALFGAVRALRSSLLAVTTF